MEKLTIYEFTDESGERFDVRGSDGDLLIQGNGARGDDGVADPGNESSLQLSRAMAGKLADILRRFAVKGHL